MFFLLFYSIFDETSPHEVAHFFLSPTLVLGVTYVAAIFIYDGYKYLSNQEHEVGLQVK